MGLNPLTPYPFPLILPEVRMAVSSKGKMNMIILCCLGFIGLGGIHRFYAGRILTGLLWLCTGGLFGIGTIIDLIIIGTDRFLDAEGNAVKAQ